MATTATETKEGRPQLVVRTTQFLKRVSTFRTSGRKSDSSIPGDASCARSAQSQSMDLGSKAFAVEVRAHHSLDHSGDSGEDSPSHLSLRHLRNSSQITQSPLTAPPRAIEGIPPTINSPIFPTVTASAHTRAQTLPSPTSAASNDSPVLSATIDGRSRRAIAPRLATLPPPLMAQYAAGGSARLTPSLVTRQPPMPILNLPTLPPPTPVQPARPARPTAPLHSLPALPMQGPSETDQEADHENASLEEEDEEDEEGDEDADGNGQELGSEESGDEEDEVSSPPTSSLAGPSRLAPLPQVDLSAFSVSFGDAGLNPSTQRTPHLHPPSGRPVDYFSSKSPDPVLSPLRTPRPSDYRPSGKGRAIDGVPQPRLVPMPATPGSPRPGLYHQGSKSMVDLTCTTRKDKDKVISPQLGRTPPMNAQTLGQDGQAPAAEAEEAGSSTEPPDDVITSPMLRRRRSLPVYEPSSDPPPYPDPLFRRRGQLSSQPLEEEGRERLPPYSNSIYLSGIMPRKMEFSEPGVQAKDRKWRRMYCVLEGTTFRVYKCPPATSGVGAIEQWWENRVGVGDLTSVNITAVTSTGIRVSAIRERQKAPADRIPKIMEESCAGQEGQSTSDRPEIHQPSPPPAPTRSKLGLTSRFLRKQRSKSVDPLRSDSANSSRTRLSMDLRSHNAGQLSTAASRHSMDTLGSSRPSNVSSTVSPSTTPASSTVSSPTYASSAASESGSLFSRSRLLSHNSNRREREGGENENEKDETYTPDPKDLLHQYSLQHAESGLASDYQKRKNVVRVRMEGEQFLLQAKNVAAVIDWIESIQMGTNIALDLDERPMPRGPIFPRRRRRRVRRVDPSGATAS